MAPQILLENATKIIKFSDAANIFTALHIALSTAAHNLRPTFLFPHTTITLYNFRILVLLPFLLLLLLLLLKFLHKLLVLQGHCS